MSRLAINNIGMLITGDLEEGILTADSLICQDGLISCIGSGLDVSDADVVIAEHLLKHRPDVCGHVNGGMTDD